MSRVHGVRIPVVFLVMGWMVAIQGLRETPAQSRTLHVPGEYKTIQTAIDAAGDTDTVLVASGTYRENLVFRGKAITVKTTMGWTTIDGQGQGAAVTFNQGEKNTTVLEGFTITGGRSPYGAIYLENASPTLRGNTVERNATHGIHCAKDASPLIQQNTIQRNRGAYVGGGIHCDQRSSPRIEENTIAFNEVDYGGGGIYCANHARPVIQNNVIRDNRVVVADGCGSALSNDEGGAGILVEDEAGPTITGNTIVRNIAAGWFGGGIAYYGSATVLANNLIAHNQARRGGGLYLSITAADLVNNTIVGNVATESGGAIFTARPTTVANSILWSNYAPEGPEMTVLNTTVTLHHGIVTGGRASVHTSYGAVVNWGAGMLAVEPRFADGYRGNFHLLATSPGRDAGDNNAAGLPDADFEGDPRISGGTVDLGRDEVHPHLTATWDAGEYHVVIDMYGPSPTPVLWAFSTTPDLLEPPVSLPGLTGLFALKPPLHLFALGTLPPDGWWSIRLDYPYAFPRPAVYPTQALLGTCLTNATRVQVK